MYQIDFGRPCHIHFIGIGGISMSGLARILLSEGFRVSGSDSCESALTEELRQLGAEIAIGQRAENITTPDVVVYTAAIHPDNPEYRAAEERKIPMLPRAELLGELMHNYKEAVNVAGTHGKTTTTSMITRILLDTGKDPTVTVGGMLDCIGGNFHVGSNELFVAEACEYTNSFLSFWPTIAAVLNVEADHLDFFKDIEDIRRSFKAFIHRVPQDERGFVVLNGDIRDLEYFTGDLGCGYATFGSGADNDYSAGDITFDSHACGSYVLLKKDQPAGRVELSVPGIHNVYNSLAAIAVCERLGVSCEQSVRALKEYRGTKRRFEIKGMRNGFTVIDDYAHHPQEIEATLKAAAMVPHRRLYVVFQSHTYTRTKVLLDDFAKALTLADEVLLADIYAAREKNVVGVSSADLAEKINALGTPAACPGDFEEIEKYILSNVKEGDLLITMGAGNVVDIAEKLISD